MVDDLEPGFAGVDLGPGRFFCSLLGKACALCLLEFEATWTSVVLEKT